MADLLFFGLGNPGKKYEQTRHNLGWQTLQAWVAEHQGSDTWQRDEALGAMLAHVSVARDGRPGVGVYCALPLVFMNTVGEAVAAVAGKYRIEVNNLLIIHDDLGLALGQIKVKVSGSAGGHNGVRSVHAALGTTDIRRLRLGIGRPADSSSDEAAVSNFVLQNFGAAEAGAAEKMRREAGGILTDLAKDWSVSDAAPL